MPGPADTIMPTSGNFSCTIAFVVKVVLRTARLMDSGLLYQRKFDIGKEPVSGEAQDDILAEAADGIVAEAMGEAR